MTLNHQTDHCGLGTFFHPGFPVKAICSVFPKQKGFEWSAINDAVRRASCHITGSLITSNTKHLWHWSLDRWDINHWTLIIEHWSLNTDHAELTESLKHWSLSLIDRYLIVGRRITLNATIGHWSLLGTGRWTLIVDHPTMISSKARRLLRLPAAPLGILPVVATSFAGSALPFGVCGAISAGYWFGTALRFLHRFLFSQQGSFSHPLNFHRRCNDSGRYDHELLSLYKMRGDLLKDSFFPKNQLLAYVTASAGQTYSICPRFLQSLRVHLVRLWGSIISVFLPLIGCPVGTRFVHHIREHAYFAGQFAMLKTRLLSYGSRLFFNEMDPCMHVIALLASFSVCGIADIKLAYQIAFYSLTMTRPLRHKMIWRNEHSEVSSSLKWAQQAIARNYSSLFSGAVQTILRQGTKPLR